jgi:hypothetical protein
MPHRAFAKILSRTNIISPARRGPIIWVAMGGDGYEEPPDVGWGGSSVDVIAQGLFIIKERRGAGSPAAPN